MDNNPKGIFILTQGNTPDTIFQNKGKDDLIYSWLREGGIGGFIGDYPLYYYWNFNTGARVTAAGAGQQNIFGVTVTNGNVAAVSPTDLGKELIPSLILNLKAMLMMEIMPIQSLTELRIWRDGLSISILHVVAHRSQVMNKLQQDMLNSSLIVLLLIYL